MPHSLKGVCHGEGRVTAKSEFIVRKQRKGRKLGWATEPKGAHVHTHTYTPFLSDPLFPAKLYHLNVPHLPKQPYLLEPNVQPHEPVGGISTQSITAGDAGTRPEHTALRGGTHGPKWNRNKRKDILQRAGERCSWPTLTSASPLETELKMKAEAGPNESVDRSVF